MASGSYRKSTPRDTIDISSTRSPVPQRSTRQLPEVEVEDERLYSKETRVIEVYEDESEPLPGLMSKAISSIQSLGRPRTPLRFTASTTSTLSSPMPVTTFQGRKGRVVDDVAPHPLERHKIWLNKYVICSLVAVTFALVLLSSAMLNREGGAQILGDVPGMGKVYDVQVGGAQAQQIQNTNGPVKQQVPLHTGPYNVLGPPTITADFINQVLSSYGSPAAGKGQALYDLGVKYGIDPAFALAFFQHESGFGKFGEARSSLSLGNLRCIPNFQCTDNYAWFPSWESGFEAWYKLIRNLYVADWGLNTVPQIIPRYAPPADNNNDDAYIASVEHSIDVWHTGQIFT